MRKKLSSFDSKSSPSFSRLTKTTLAPLGCALALAGTMQAAPYASNIRVTGTTVTFILNEPSDALKYTINNGPQQTLDGSTKGTKSFSLGSPTDKFSIMAGKSAATGYTIPTGTNLPVVATGLSQISAAAGLNLISDDTNPLNRFNSGRGVSVSTKPGSTNFGTVYIANSAAGTTAGVVRTLGDGLYALNSDQSDAFGYGNTAKNPGGFFDALGTSASSPFRVYAATNGEVYVADFSDPNGNIYRENFDLTLPADGGQVLVGIGGPSTVPPTQNHGSTLAVHVEGSLAGGNMVVYTIDEDLTNTVAADKNSLWRYDINAGPLPSSVAQVKVNQTNALVAAATSDMQRGNDGKFYLAQNRSGGAETGVAVLSSTGVALYDSLSASRAMLANPTAADILRNVQGVAVSEDQKWLAVMINNSDVGVIPLTNGIPDLANRLVVDTGTDITSGRDIAFDAAGNIHYISSGQALYRVIAPGGVTWATTTRDGSTNTFSIVTGQPKLSLTHTGSQATISWTYGTLQESTSVTGPWIDSATQTSPVVLTPSTTKFYRVHAF